MRRITYIGPAKLEFENGGILSLDDQYEKAQRAQMYPNIEPTIPPAEPYVRPSDWLTIPDVNAGDEAFYGLFAIFDHDSNYAKIYHNQNYKVDWGVGAGNVSYAGNTYATQYYDFADFDNSTLTSRGYKQVVIKIYPDTGKHLEVLDVCIRDQGPVAQTNWLDIAVAGPYLIYLGLNQNYGNRCGYLEQVKIEQNNIDYWWNSMFAYCYSLQNVRYIDTRNATYINGLYYNCRSLASIPDIVTNTPVDRFQDGFALCYSLRQLPWIDLSGAIYITHLHDGSYITKHPPYNLSNNTSLYQAFWRTRYLQEIPNYNTSKALSWAYTFDGCYGLRRLPTLDATSSNNDYWDGTFRGCFNLEIIDNIITSADSAYKNSQFNDDAAVTILGPGFNTVNSLNMEGMFYGLSGLKYAPAITAPNATNVYRAFITWGPAPLKFSAPLATNTREICIYSNPVSIDLDIPNGTDLRYAFYCNADSINVKTTSAVTQVSGAFVRSKVFKAPALNLTNVQDCTDLYNFGRTAIIPEATEQDWSNVRILDGTFGYTFNLWSIPAYNWSNVTSMSNTFSNYGPQVLHDLRAYGMTTSFNIRDSWLGKSATEYMFNNLGIANAAAQTVTVSYRSNGNYRSVVSKTVTTTAGSKTVTCTDTSNLVTGYCVTGTGITSTVSVTFTDSGDTVNLTAHGLTNDTPVGFTSITTTTGIATYTVYYVVNAGTDSFQISTTKGGSAVTLTNDGSGTMYYANYIASIITNTSVTLTAPASASGTVTMSATYLDTSKAVIKGWAVSFPV